MISVEQKLKELGRDRGPFSRVAFRLGGHPGEYHTQILRPKAPPSFLVQHNVIDVSEDKIRNC